MQCKQEENLGNCPCSYPDCPRKGMCCDCVDHHRRKGEIPACFFPAEYEAETTNDRSIDNFIAAHEKYKKSLDKANSEFPNQEI
jgi:hypothetical protein